MTLSQFFPICDWLRHYSRQDFEGDIFAGIITAILLVPQGIAYAILAGLPPQMGLYASIFPTAVYALMGTSRTLSVGPVSIAAIMIASTLSTPEIRALGSPQASALILAAECGVILLAMAFLRMGGLVNFISHPVLAGFTSGAAVLIIVSQIPLLTGLPTPHCGLTIDCYPQYLQTTHFPTLSIGIGGVVVLFLFGNPLSALLKKLKLPLTLITGISKCGPLLTIFLATFFSAQFNLPSLGIAVVGEVPSGFPSLSLGFLAMEKWRALLQSAIFITLIAYVESVAIAKVTANLKGEKIVPNRELIALGMANITSAISGGMTVAGGFSRTMVNFSAGARSQMAMLIAATLLAVTVTFFSAGFAVIPKAALAAVIIIAVYRLVRIKHILHTYNYDHGDGITELVTLLGVVILGIEQGITLGIILTIANQLRKTSQPEITTLGRAIDTGHYQNSRYSGVETWHHLLMVRVDESLTFANISYVEDYLSDELNRQPNIKHVVLIFSSVNHIDATALEALELVNQSLKNAGKTLNISEAKGSVLDKLHKTHFVHKMLPGKLFAKTEDAAKELG